MESLHHDLDSPLASRRFLPWLLVLFVGSGCAALIYEIVWLQLLQLVIGASGYSLGVLLGTFMGGMCLGSLILPRIIPRSIHPLKVYAFLELGIGIIGILVLKFMGPLSEVYVNYASVHHEHNVLIRAAVAAICLIPPTLLMGATLPAIARWVETTPEGVSWMGFFYGGNIVGAVFGCLGAGFYLLRLYDMPTATYVAAGINLLVMIFALVLAQRTPHVVPSSDEPAAPPLEDHGDFGGVAAVYLTIALSGLCALGAEVVWTRLLSLMLGATVYTFSIILAVFLVGLGIGSSAGAAAARSSRNPRAALGWCQLLIAVAVAWAAWQISDSLPFWPVDPTMDLGAMNASRPWLSFQLDIVRAAWVVLPGAILWGASFPLALAGVASRGKDPGRMVGSVYASNTLGAIAGSLLFSMVVIPNLGTQTAERMLIVIAMFSAIIALAPYIVPGRRGSDEAAEPAASTVPFSLPSLIVVVLILGFLGARVAMLKPAPWVAVAWGRVSAAQMSSCDPVMVTGDEQPSGKYDRYCTYVGEGMNVSVAITKSIATGAQYFHGAGKVQASSDPKDMRLQRMLGHLSVLAHKDPDSVKDVLVVACGAGVTAGSFVPYPHVKNVTICDIEPLVPTQVTPKFSSVNYGITDNITVANPVKEMDGKRIEVAFDDGRHYIRTLPKDKKYDIITSDPIDPWVKGCAALNTVEYYQMCKEHLNPGGVMSLWIPLYESNDETAKSVIGTFFQVFKHGIVFSNDEHGEGYDAVLFGINDDAPARIDVDAVQALLDRADYGPVKASLMEVGFGVPHTESGKSEDYGMAVDLLATYAGRADDLQNWLDAAPKLQINTDSNLRLQYLAGLWLNSYVETQILNGMLKEYRFPDQLFVGSPERVRAMRQALADEGREKLARTRGATTVGSAN